MQPDSGGYLEATPLTAFVVMSLASIYRSPRAPREEMGPPSSRDVAPEGGTDCISRSEMPTVIREGVKFLINSIRPDGSWPIDTNLATWNTTLAINALAGAGEDLARVFGRRAVDNEYMRATRIALVNLPGSEIVRGTARDSQASAAQTASDALEWLLSCQHRIRHPFTGADAGGFGWSDLSGAVPDADDTPGALLAIANRGHQWNSELDEEGAFNALEGTWSSAALWLLNLQNRDGGWPTFCRGWGKLPFDRSGTDLTAHVIRAINWRRPWDPYAVGFLRDRIHRAITHGLKFIRRAQHPDGSWSPLWFGNQDHPEEDNPVYGTAKVLMAYRDLGLMDSPEAQRGVEWLVGNQNADGGWGSGVWRKAGELKSSNCKLQIADCETASGEAARNAEPVTQSGVESEGLVTGSATGSHPVPGTQYSVLSTGQDDAMPVQSQLPNPQSQIASNPKSKIQNLKSSVEETALAVEALLAACPRNATEGVPYSAVARGLAWLIERVEAGQHRQPAPIGFYFAKLWYYERLYPLTFTVAALGRACRQFAHPVQLDSHADPAPARAP
jgi:squalene-hopene/tetraprenyl-beta-curcumene cyclase